MVGANALGRGHSKAPRARRRPSHSIPSGRRGSLQSSHRRRAASDRRSAGDRVFSARRRSSTRQQRRCQARADHGAGDGRPYPCRRGFAREIRWRRNQDADRLRLLRLRQRALRSHRYAAPARAQVPGRRRQRRDAASQRSERSAVAWRTRREARHPCGACKLSELLFVEAVRSYVDTLGDSAGGWLAALKDRHVSAALALMHGHPERPWTLDLLAERIGASRSMLAERFVRLMGQAPMQYLSQWRLHLAADALASSDSATKRIASDAGFGSTAAFSRAFKREFGIPPARWRAAAPRSEARP